MAFQIEYAYTSHIGKVRTNNEDNFWCLGHSMEAENNGLGKIVHGTAALKDFPFFAVFDGMGGESQGEMASYLAAQAAGEFYAANQKQFENNPREFMEKLCSTMNHAVCAYAEENKVRSMGSTAAVLMFAKDRFASCNLGDSRIYQLHERELYRLSSDHVLGGGRFGKSPLMQYVGMDEKEMKPEPSIESATFAMDDCYLLCSDGITDMLSDSEIGEILKEDLPVEELAEKLLKQALEKGGRDNITLVVCRVSDKNDSSFQRLFDRIEKIFGGEK